MENLPFCKSQGGGGIGIYVGCSNWGQDQKTNKNFFKQKLKKNDKDMYLTINIKLYISEFLNNNSITYNFRFTQIAGEEKYGITTHCSKGHF